MTEPALLGKTIVVIGGTTGLGLSAVRACLAEGARVVAVGRKATSVAAVSTLGENIRALIGDATDPDTAPKAIDEAMSAFGSFDGLYHVAGGSGRGQGDGPLHELSDEGIEYTLDINLKSVLYSNRAAVRRFLEEETYGSVVNMGSALAFSPSPRYFATHTYTAAKAGIIGLSRAADADAAVVFFLSDASRFVTGQVLAVDGGWSVSEGQHGGDS